MSKKNLESLLRGSQLPKILSIFGNLNAESLYCTGLACALVVAQLKLVQAIGC